MASKIVECKTCKKEVSQSAKTCPHCGESMPGISMKKGCLSLIGTAFLFSFIVALFVDAPPEKAPSEESSKVENSEPAKPSYQAWFEGGTLHKADQAQWQAGSERDRLATVADFLYTVSPAFKAVAEADVTSPQLKKTAQAVVICIDTTYKDLTTEQASISDVPTTAAICINLMGLTKKETINTSKN